MIKRILRKLSRVFSELKYTLLIKYYTGKKSGVICPYCGRNLTQPLEICMPRIPFTICGCGKNVPLKDREGNYINGWKGWKK